MAQSKGSDAERIRALKVHQWLEAWDDLEFDPAMHRRKPEPYFYIASIAAPTLRRLSAIYRRTKKQDVEPSFGIQRRHDVKRSKEITQYVKNGFPWSQLSAQRRKTGEYDDLRKPGWLPTSIVVNLLTADDQRNGKSVAGGDLVRISGSDEEGFDLLLPAGIARQDWRPSSIPPIEVIDGQHRLWAFDMKNDDFELPVVCFHGLDISWQAYLFYSINITPKKINRSLAYDLYPLLRSEDWLDRFEGTPVYRESRSQELTEALWSFPDSPWFRRIDMLGEHGRKQVSQAAWIGALMATFVRAYSGRGVRRTGGIFGAAAGEDELVISWSSAQQAAFLIRAWQLVEEAIGERHDSWMEALRNSEDDQPEIPELDPEEGKLDLAFAGSFTLLNSDQGVRGYQHVVNGLCHRRAEELELANWTSTAEAPGISDEVIAGELDNLKNSRLDQFLRMIAETVAPFDWRTSKAPGLVESERREKARFRGSGGYKELRLELYDFIADAGPIEIAEPAEEIVELER